MIATTIAMMMRLSSGTKAIKNVKSKKHKLKKMPIAWHQSRWWDWCVPQDEKKETEKLWG